MPNHIDILREMDVCQDAIEWYNGRDSEGAWRDCKRGDWMLWIAARLGVDSRAIRQAEHDCAKLCLTYRPFDTVTAANFASDAYNIAILASVRAAFAASVRGMNCEVARKNALRRCAELVRARIPWEMVATAIEHWST